uniref:HNH endonuclease n=1 Tax=viral metagenome TaxID=1070528 RepID=A0A6C0D2M8_9ZZZZ
MDTDTKPLVKSCSRCGETKEFEKFISKRNICKICSNRRDRENRQAVVLSNDINKTCTTCNQDKPLTSFSKHRASCKDCSNEKRRNRYQTDENHRKKAIQAAQEFKHAKVLVRRQKKLEEIGEGNKKCSNCSINKPICRYRHNRLKCKDCDRDEPIQRFKRNVRSRIFIALKQNKVMHTIEYLGCTTPEYLAWMTSYNECFTLGNQGKEWHIDHVIPLAKFDLNDSAQQLIAFNWRNTMPLSPAENMKKNSKILPLQIEEHLKKLIDYHKKKEIIMPQVFIDLFAKHLVDGNPLKQLLPLQFGNSLEEHG